MSELLTAAQMRAIEAAAIASGDVSGLELMERAGRGVVEAVFEEWPELRATAHRAVVLCGPGGNGGDGFVVARLLKEWGWEVEVFLYGDPERMPPDARVNYERWLGMGEVRDAVQIEDEDQLIDLQPDLFIDALFGIGLNRPISVPVKDIGGFMDYSQRWVFDSGAPTVSIDVPSGLCSDSGRSLGASMTPALVVTFHAPKVGHLLADNDGTNSAKLRVVDIGLPRQHKLKLTHKVAMMLPEGQRRTVWTVVEPHGNLPKQQWFSHKYSHGHALILSGPSGRSGAARLAARGALRIGAGVVTVGCPEGALAEHAARLDAVMLRAVADGAALAGVLEDRRINALCLGPGMGVGARGAELVGVALQRRGEPRPTVLDADALTILAQRPDLFAALHDGCVLTPHAGEFARLFPDIALRLAAPATAGPAYSKVDACREAAARAGCVVLFKGPDTVIAGPDGRCAINSAAYERAAPWLATAGSGDVLAGFITGLLARGVSPFDAACSAAWLHVECARSFGPGLIAEDLPEELPKVFRALGL
jgi:hydroxyethylthiazole kinase-like uncharacterized protein yjeF